MQKKVVLVGHADSRAVITPITRDLRIRGHQSSAYFDDSAPFAARELDSADFFLIGLSRVGRDANTDAHRAEKALLEAVKKLPYRIPCGIISDIDGNISAPYLVTHGELFRLVASSEPKQVESLELFKEYRVVTKEPIAITDAICDVLHAPVRATA